MHRRRRYAFTICSAISLGLCVAVCGLWARSSTRVDVAHWAGHVDAASHSQTCVSVCSADGVFTFLHTRNEYSGAVTYVMRSGGVSAPAGGAVSSYPFSGIGLGEQSLGFNFVRAVEVTPLVGPWQSRSWYWGVAVPYWSAALVLVALPAWWVIGRVRRRSRARAGRCVVCRYDLRAHANGERCPECGTAVI